MAALLEMAKEDWAMHLLSANVIKIVWPKTYTPFG